ncbi:MAG TPA: ABC transporter ATP-binding protein [Caldisericia bacterium]|nr:ABC transporter ATP-binding protein [Caldisericia bacterium]
MTKLFAEKLSKTLDGLEILQNISLEVETGSVTSIIGPSGCGKSTFLHLLAGLISPDQGRVLIDGQDYTGKTGRMGYLQQKDCLFPWKTLLANVILPLQIKKWPLVEARAKAMDYLSKFKLEGFENYYPSELSGGMRQRAALLRTYLYQSDILLLDEPFAQLDAISRKRMQEWLLAMKEDLDLTIVMITHDIDEAVFLSDQVVVFSPLPARMVLSLKLHPPSMRKLSYVSSPEFVENKSKIMDALYHEDTVNKA